MSPEEETTINRSTMKLMDKLYKALKQRDQYKAERDTLIEDLSWYKAKVSGLERENRFLLSRKDNLFDSWRDENKRSVALSKKIEQLERENEKLKEIKQEKEQLEESFQYQLEKRLEYFNKYQELKKENKALRLQSDTYFEQWQQHKALNSEFSQHIGNKPSSSTYKYFRGKLNALEIREGD